MPKRDERELLKELHSRRGDRAFVRRAMTALAPGLEQAYHSLGDGREFGYEPDLSDPSEAAAHRAMMAVQRAFREEYAGEKEGPNVTIFASVPPDGRVGIATTEPDLELALAAVLEAQGALRRTLRLVHERAQRQ